jgi:hypothetical protein
MCNRRRRKAGLSALPSPDGTSARAEAIEGPSIPDVSFRSCGACLFDGNVFLAAALANEFAGAAFELW